MKPSRAQQHEALLTDIAQAMSNQNQRAALRLLGDNSRRSRQQLLNFYPDFDGMRREAKAVRTKTMANLEFYLTQLTSNLTARGAKVHRAPTPESAVQYILDVAERNGVRLAVKGKSITSEEIDLNAHLEARGIRVVETDLGELILQMARERPSHIIAPAVHKTKEQVAELFSKELGRPIPAEPERIAAEARLHLREFFLKADLGITGVNMAIAESGTLMLVTNEGNGRLVTSLPRIHIALMGCEKVVPTLKDALMLLRLLIVSAVGQKITSCVSLITGPNLTAFPLGGSERKELHVVILDNGRLTMSQDPHFNSAMNCIRCGACLNACPTYQLVGGHVFGDRYVGPIGLPWTAFTTSQPKAFQKSPLCINCGLCRAACPVDVEIPEMIMRIKHLDIAENGTSRVNRFLSDFERMSTLASATAPVSNWLIKRGLTRILLEKVVGIDRRRHLPTYSRHPFTKQWRKRKPALQRDRTVAYFVDTYAEYNEPDLAWRVVDVLEHAGYAVTVPTQRGVGMPLASYGFMEAFEENARFNVSSLTKTAEQDVPIVASEPTAAYCLKHLYPHLLNSSESRLVAEHSFELFEFLRLQLKEGTLPMDHDPLEGTVAYHAPCHTKSVFREWPVVPVLEKFGLKVKTVEYGCCGIAGTYGFKRGLEGYEVSMEIQRGLIETLQSLNADFAVTESSVCRMQIEASYGKPVIHPIRLLWNAYFGSKNESQSS